MFNLIPLTSIFDPTLNGAEVGAEVCRRPGPSFFIGFYFSRTAVEVSASSLSTYGHNLRENEDSGTS